MGIIKTGVVRRTNLKGGRKLYATGVSYSNINDEGLISYLQQNGQLSRGLAVAAIEAFRAAFNTFLMNGHSMTIPSLGSFSLTCNSDTKKVTTTPVDNPQTEAEKEQMKEFKKQLTAAIRNIRVSFNPVARVRMSAKSVRFHPVIIEDDTQP